MNDPRDFLALCRFAVPGLILIGLGLAGVFVHRRRNRVAASFCVALLGCLLTLIGAAAFHHVDVPVSMTILVVGTGGASLVLARQRHSRSSPN